jgi:hypothetical protein
MVLLGVCFLLAQTAFPEDGSDVEFSRPSFIIFHEAGKFEEGVSEYVLDVKDQWVHRSGAFLKYTAVKNERAKLNMQVGGVYWNPTRERPNEYQSRVRYFAASVPRLNVEYSFGDVDAPPLTVTGGLFIYGYNKHVRNLGSYIFRTGIYDGSIVTGGLNYVNTSLTQLTGLKISHNPGGGFKHDLLLTLENQVIPFWDLNVTYLAQYNLANILNLGAGIQFARLLAVRPSATAPMKKDNRYFEANGKTYVDRRVWYMRNYQYYDEQIAPLQDEVDILDPVADAARIAALNAEIAALNSKAQPFRDDEAFRDSVIAADTLGAASDPGWEAFSGKGIKPMVMASFDPKPLLGLDILGKNDLVLYFETAVLGIKNQPVFYEEVSQRIPLLVGFNIPTFKLLDVLAVEIERNPSRFPNSTQYTRDTFYPQPTLAPAEGYHPDKWKDDDIKWSVYAQKQLNDWLSVFFQAAKDNTRGWEWGLGRTAWAIFYEKSHWYWMTQVKVVF